MKNNTNEEILDILEQLAAAFPWDAVDICIKRQPTGEYSCRVWLDRNDKYGFDYQTEFGATPAEAANLIIEKVKDRNPEAMRQKKIAELRAQLEKLQAVVIGLPPYRPGRELAERNGNPTHGRLVVDI